MSQQKNSEMCMPLSLQNAISEYDKAIENFRTRYIILQENINVLRKLSPKSVNDNSNSLGSNLVPERPKETSRESKRSVADKVKKVIREYHININKSDS